MVFCCRMLVYGANDCNGIEARVVTETLILGRDYGSLEMCRKRSPVAP